MPSTKPVTNSHRNTALAARSSLIAPSLHPGGKYTDMTAVLDDGGDNHHHGHRQRQEHLPAEPHELIVAIARHNRLGHGEQEKQKERLEHEPDRPRHPGERRIRHWRPPAAEKQD